MHQGKQIEVATGTELVRPDEATMPVVIPAKVGTKKKVPAVVPAQPAKEPAKKNG